jgi:translation initiation factor 2 subunit 2
MADETSEQMFDPSALKKKKKTKKTPFDLDAELSTSVAPTPQPAPVEEILPEEESVLDDELNLDSFGGKKKKKKKGITFDDVEKVLDEIEDQEEDVNMEFIDQKKKKKKKSGKKLDDLMLEDEVDKENEIEGDEDEDSQKGQSWLGSDRDYTYDELLTRVFDIMRQKNPEMASGTKQKFVMRPPQVVRVGTKKTSFVNFMEICKMLHRHQKHLLDFLLSELGTSGSIDGCNQLIIKGRFQQKQIENVLRRYIKEYVTCHTCRSPNTILQKDSRIFFLQCEACGSRCSVVSIKHGFQAVTGKRAAMRAKAT